MKKIFIRIFACIFLISMFLHYTPVSEGSAITGGETLRTGGTVLYVKDTGASTSCTSWDDACTLQTALGLAVAGNEIWVAAGTYTPSTSDSNAHFDLVNGVAVYGGFAGTEMDFSQRDWEVNITTLSGEIGAPGDLTDNSRHIVTGSYLDSMSILDGFAISDGYNTDSWGSGFYCYDCDVILSNLLIDNSLGILSGLLLLRVSEQLLAEQTAKRGEAGGKF